MAYVTGQCPFSCLKFRIGVIGYYGFGIGSIGGYASVIQGYAPALPLKLIIAEDYFIIAPAEHCSDDNQKQIRLSHISEFLKDKVRINRIMVGNEWDITIFLPDNLEIGASGKAFEIDIVDYVSPVTFPIVE